MTEDVINKTKENMQNSIEALKKDFMTIRSGKVSTSILDNVKVDYYGTPTALSQVASILTPDATTITVSPWEKHLLGAIEKAIQSSNIGVNPNNDGEIVKLFFPPMTVEQRQENVKKVKVMVENTKVAIRNVRKSSNNNIKTLEKDKEITSDESKSLQDDIQKITDEYTAKSDALFKEKEVLLLKV
ncbi:MAG: Ribosome recycling factor [uncultured Campylobacterales bacterium]|uniref:Ribosome-recycling factor n=1 Tax=uncultured Campylobacterales bacterium TaxID=352960 RepID=A0A6S6SWZ4_9BACT|nr:MAG: Ribosome recycling factor [uncultured Campylobacterales bacterium]